MPTSTLLPLETLRDYVSYHPYHFYQLADQKKVPVTSNCNTLLREYAWQSHDGAAREDIRKAIFSAEQGLVTYLNYDVSTRYRSEQIDVGFLRGIGSRPGQRYPYYSGPYWSGYGWWNSPALAELKVGKLSKIATLTWTSIGDGFTSITDELGSGLKDTFTATVADSTTDPDLVGVFVPAADQYPANRPLEEWQIRPVTVTRKDANTLQVTGPCWLIVKPKLVNNPVTSPLKDWQAQGVNSSEALDPNTDGNYLSAVTFYKKVYSNENQATWEVEQAGGTVTSIQVWATINDAELGSVRLDFASCPSMPGACLDLTATQRVLINYEAGEAIKDWEQIVCRFALAELRKRIGYCEDVYEEVKRWQQDLSQIATGGTEGFRVPDVVLNNPFGTRRGHVEAWEAVEGLALIRGFNLANY